MHLELESGFAKNRPRVHTLTHTDLPWLIDLYTVGIRSG